MKLLIILVLVCTSLAQYEEQYANFQQRMGRHWSQIQEKEEHLSAYTKNMNQCRKKQKEGSITYKCGQTSRADWTDQEWAATLKVKYLDKGQFASPPEKNLKVGALASVDWREEGKVSAIKDQGTCGSCWAFITAAMYEIFLMVHGQPEQDLSEEYVLECTTDYFNNGYTSSCLGGYVDFSIDMAHQTGLPTQADFPYIATSYGSNAGYPTSPGICTTSNLVRLDNVTVAFNKYQAMTDQELKDVIAYGPVGALMYVEAGIYSYQSGVYNGCPANETESINNINHAVVIVGYTADGHWIIKNSWGTAWGDNGFAIIDKDADCALKHNVYELRGDNQALSESYIKYSLLLLGLIVMLIV